jgi:hypothetical protein
MQREQERTGRNSPSIVLRVITDIHILQDDIADYRANRGRLLTTAMSVHRSSFLHFVAYKHMLSSMASQENCCASAKKNAALHSDGRKAGDAASIAHESSGFPCAGAGVLRRRE